MWGMEYQFTRGPCLDTLDNLGRAVDPSRGNPIGWSEDTTGGGRDFNGSSILGG